MNKDEFVTKYFSNMLGLLMSAFHASEKVEEKLRTKELGVTDYAAHGAYMMKASDAAKKLLRQMWEDFEQQKKAGVK